MIKKGDKVEISYKIKVGDKVVEENINQQLMIGDENTLSGINNFLLELCDKDKEEIIGVKKTLNIKAEDGFGNSKKELVVAIPKKIVGENKVNDSVVLNLTTGKSMYGLIKEEKEDTFIIDCNHPLADKDLEIDIEILDVA